MDAHGEEVACVQRRAWMELPQNRFLRGIYLLVQRYLRHNVGMQGAALAFYLLFMIFPLLIFVSSLLGLLQLDVDAILAAVQEFLPREIVSFIGVYLTYVGRNPSVKLLLFGLFFSGTLVLPSMRVMINDWDTSGKVYSRFNKAAAPKQALTPGQLSYKIPFSSSRSICSRTAP